EQERPAERGDVDRPRCLSLGVGHCGLFTWPGDLAAAGLAGAVVAGAVLAAGRVASVLLAGLRATGAGFAVPGCGVALRGAAAFRSGLPSVSARAAVAATAGGGEGAWLLPETSFAPRSSISERPLNRIVSPLSKIRNL